ncbi:EF-hand calcium-binding domain-containing protein 4B-like isoform X2 [Scyliorhinus torazame]|uniref:EF-hand calcium-binding domain-containing protein 4B-like isoform X2 n=1 Tax=Scyliorhinus torazame TaxID=75743 RepID=UPI003B5A53AC
MAALEEVSSAETASKTRREDDNGLTLLRGLEVMDWKRAEVHNNEQMALMEKAREFFQICDREEKGFINRTDMQHLQSELSLSSGELQDVFDSLDTDGNGSLTLEEFTTGFGQFLFGEKNIADKINKCQDQSGSPYRNKYAQQIATVDDEHHFNTLMDSLGAKNLFQDQREIQNLWTQLRKDEPHLLTNFEEILTKVSTQIQEANKEKEMMEFALKRKAADYGEEINHLENEMEQQIKNEKDRMFNQSSELKSRCQELEDLLRVKEQEQEQLIQEQNRLERRCIELQSEKQESKLENQRLKQMNVELEEDLQKTNDDLLRAQHQVLVMQEETSKQREEREMELYRVSEGLEREKLSLCKQLDLLRKGNDCEELSNSEPSSKNLEYANGHRHTQKGTDKEPVAKTRPRSYLQRIISIEEDPLPQFLEMQSTTHLKDWIEMEEELEEGEEEEFVGEERSLETGKVPPPPGREPARKGVLTEGRESRFNPDRLFKIIFIGNSSVGKSSVLRRFCGDSFFPGMCATVGIDYQVKTVNVGDCLLALQLWDTAGQERFRSVTKQFFRKADGVVLIYDITTAISFHAVRQWLQSVQEGAGPGVLILLLANKTDLEDERQVASDEGRRLAKGCNLLFYECSAFSGINITESMMHLARLLMELEDKEKEKTVELREDPPQQKTCCAK